ncbi:PREDICTED: 60S ribosomal protein L6-like [Priapulus caudatus]|uniref:Large ribosomal subunit protein eL6 n=1 Tax=Priapulus caudatus TaxID=37621 RepID=A0ABM1F529_PRICU|nr:PREDICTED: 60S ribosomal protein L6-like [Priapulus caudatus]
MASEQAKTRKPRNYALPGGVMRFSQSRMYKKRAIYKRKKSHPPVEKPKRETRIITKQIGGSKNGGERKVRVVKMSRYYPTEDKPKRPKTRKLPFSKHKRNLRPTITPGTVLILLAGRHKGKKVVFLKQLGTGLLLITGPFKLNGCPLRRINQIYVIATKTKIDVSDVNVPENINDEFFRRQKLKKPRHAEGEIFEAAKQKYEVNQERKDAQVAVDSQVMDAVRKSSDKKLLFGYMGTMFSLKNHQYPHKMVF